MAEENLDLQETKFDAIVLGTGLVESIIAGALARAGKRVLHLDSNDHYGGNWSVFGFKELLKWCQQVRKDGDAQNDGTKEPNAISYKTNFAENYRNVQVDIPGSSSNASLFTDDSATDIEERLSNDEAVADALRRSRSYNLDIAPKLLSCEGELVEILIRSGVGRYLEFKGVDDIFMFDEKTKHLEKVPSSREDVFGNKSITLVDKRKLMRFLTFAINYQEDPDMVEGYREKPFATFLQEKFKITGQLLTALAYAIALVDTKVGTMEGLMRTQKFMKSLGRFTKGGFLCTLYGGGSEIAQAFCRVCAVYGGIYVLNQPLSSFLVKEGKCAGVLTADGQKFEAENVVASIDYLPKSWLPDAAMSWHWISRAIVITDKPLAVSEDAKGTLYLSVLPPVEGAEAANPVYAIHQNSESMACPDDQYVTYLWKVAESGENDLRPVVDQLLNSQIEGPVSAKYAVYYQQREQQVDLDKQQWKFPANVVPCSGPTHTLDFEDAVNEAKAVFLRCVPAETEFMPSQEEIADDEE